VQESPSFRARPALAVDLPPSAAPSLTARTWGGTAAKSLYVPLDTESPTVAWLEVTKLQSPIHRQLHALRWWLVLGILGGVGIAMLVGYGLARRALRPVAALTAAAQEMQDEPTGTLPTDFGGEDELTELADTFNGLIERLRASLQRERRFRADAAHNMFTPLTALQSELDVTLRHPRSDTEYRAALRTVRRHTETISSLLEELMTLSRIEGRTEPPGPAPTNATACLRRRVERVRARAKAQEITLDWQAPDALEVPVADDDLTLIADHLLDNALKYTPEGGIVQVAVHASNSDVVIRVSDDGIGIDADGADRLFDRFYRHADAEEAAPGGGLGLSIVQAVVRSYDGSISVQSPGPGEGSTFTVRLPR
jgi:signal transduction histidine kinase